MRNHNKKSGINYKMVRGGAASVLAALLLSSCTSMSVPDAINPTKWDFFADDAAVPENADATTASDQGLAADASAPQPAESGNNSGLSADASSGNYASPPIERQGAPADYLSSDASKIDEAPSPQAVAVTPVRAAPTPMARSAPAPAPSAPSAAAPSPVRIAEAPPGEPQFNAPAPVPAQSPATIIKPMISNETPPPPPRLQVRGPVVSKSATFDTVVISSGGIEDTSSPVTRPGISSIAPTTYANANVRFPVPGNTTAVVVSPVNVGGMLRVATIYFNNNSDSLNSRDKDIVAASAQLLSERGGSLYVVGHASSRTSDMDYIKHAMTNFQISTARANQVTSALKSMGVDASQLRTHALSDTVPLYFEVMPSGEAGNRRVEIYLSH